MDGLGFWRGGWDLEFFRLDRDAALIFLFKFHHVFSLVWIFLFRTDKNTSNWP